MRSENEVLALILNVANADERIRAVLLNGSKANPNSKRDIFQDFDIVYMVNEIDTFIRDHSWIDIFGERIILQMPAQMEIEEIKNEPVSFSYLMLFKDRNRIDLTLFPVDKIKDEFEKDSLTLLLLDKDNLFSSLPPSGNIDYLIEKPTEKMFRDCCNEFWWVCPYVAKGLWRQEIIYAKDMLENPVRKMFLKLIEWHIGVETGFSVSFGKSGKNMQAYISPELYNKIISTYPNAEAGSIWKSLFIMAGIVSDLAKDISKKLSFEYHTDEEDNVVEYLQWAYALTKEK